MNIIPLFCEINNLFAFEKHMFLLHCLKGTQKAQIQIELYTQLLPKIQLFYQLVT